MSYADENEYVKNSKKKINAHIILYDIYKLLVYNIAKSLEV